MDIGSCFLDGNADAVEFCPHDPFSHILAAATYTLEEGTQPHRGGSISIFSADSKTGLQLLDRVQRAGVFDIKWSPAQNNTNPLLAQADSDGCVSLLSIQAVMDEKDEGIAGCILKEVCKEKISPAMCLCVDWNPSAVSVCLGLSDGSLCQVAVREAELQIVQSWVAHDFELWAAMYDQQTPHLVYAGSDDCRFSCWDLRENPSKLVFQNAKSHKMGVCCINQNPMNANVLLTGSYDEYIRLWDIRSTSTPVIERSLSLGGGVWRIKYHPQILDLVLAACMHNGFAIVKIGKEGASIVETYDKHGSLAYGADWQRGKGLQNSFDTELVATCSFYDRALRLWQPNNLTENP